MNRILKAEPNLSIKYAGEIVDTRNRIIHGYDSVSDEIIWMIAVRHLPVHDMEIKEIQKKI